jgi:hydrogenase expression/formation protein HypC
MCIAMPCKVVSVNGDEAVVELDGVRRTVMLDLVEDVREGDYLIVHAGFALNKVDQEEAERTLAMVREMGNLDGLMSP